MSGDMVQNAALILAVINCWTMFRFWQDKARAVKGVRRTPESELLMLALIGGTPGAFLARKIFRHKTRKQPFSAYLYLILLLQAGGLLAYQFV